MVRALSKRSFEWNDKKSEQIFLDNITSAQLQSEFRKKRKRRNVYPFRFNFQSNQSVVLLSGWPLAISCMANLAKFLASSIPEWSFPNDGTFKCCMASGNFNWILYLPYKSKMGIYFQLHWFHWPQHWMLFTRKTLRMSMNTFIGAGNAIEWLRQSRDRNSLKSHELHEQNATFSPLRFIRVAKINLFSAVIVSNQFWNSRNTVGNVSCRSISDCVIPVKFLQNSLNIGTRVGRTNLWNSDSICPVLVFSKTAGYSV